jgi:cytochrome c2
MKMESMAALATLSAMLPTSAHAAGDPQQGQKVFTRACKPCHVLEAGKNGIGPSLHGLFGRKAGSVPGYAYPAAMKASKIVWNDETLKRFLIDPHSLVPGDRWRFPASRTKRSSMTSSPI